jgi:hypothetical protein
MNMTKSRKTSNCHKPACALTKGGKAITFDFGPAKHTSQIDWYVQLGQKVPVSACRAGTGRIEDDKRRGEFKVTPKGKAVAITMRAALKVHHNLGIDEVGFSVKLPKNTSLWAWQTHYPASTAPGLVLRNNFTYGCLKLVMFKWQGKVLRFVCKWQVGEAYTAGTIVKDDEGWTLNWRWEVKSPYPQRTGWMPPVEFEVFDSFEEAAAEYGRWIGREFKLKPREENPNIPAWFHQTRSVVGLWLIKNDGTQCHDFKDVERLTAELERIDAPRDTMLYLMGWDDGYGPRLGMYETGKRNGGDAGLKRLCAVAHKRGFRIVLHGSVYILDMTVREYRETFFPAVIRTGYWREAHWPAAGREYDFPIPLGKINPNYKPWREHVIKGLSRLIGLGVDGFMFDGIDGQPNDPGYGNTSSGLEIIFTTLRERHPELLLTSETPTERAMQWMAGFAPYGTDPKRLQVGDHTGEGCDKAVFDFAPMRAILAPYVYLFAHDGGFPIAVKERGAVITKREDFRQLVELQRQRDDFACVSLNFRDHGIDPAAKRLILRGGVRK